MNFDLLEVGAKIGIYFVPFLFALSFHEFAHGWVANRLGDNTAKLMGRLTLNPMAHADILGTFILPLITIVTGSSLFFGWAKPVPVNERNLRHPQKDMFWVASAGPISNLLLAFVSSFLMVFIYSHFKEAGFYGGALNLLQVFIQTNLALAIFNLIPIHPLDGGKVVARFLPDSWNRKMEEHQQMLSMLLMFLFFSGAMSILRFPITWFYQFFLSLAEKTLL